MQKHAAPNNKRNTLPRCVGFLHSENRSSSAYGKHSPDGCRSGCWGGADRVSGFPAWGFSIPISGSRTTGIGICSGPGTSSPTLDL